MQRVHPAFRLTIFTALTTRFCGFARTQNVQVELYTQIHTRAMRRSCSKTAIRVAFSPPANRDFCVRSGTCEAPLGSAGVGVTAPCSSLGGHGNVACPTRHPSTLLTSCSMFWIAKLHSKHLANCWTFHQPGCTAQAENCRQHQQHQPCLILQTTS